MLATQIFNRDDDGECWAPRPGSSGIPAGLIDGRLLLEDGDEFSGWFLLEDDTDGTAGILLEDA